MEIIKWPAGEYHDWHDDKIYYHKTTITYLNEDYEGGRTTVEDYTVEPKTGKIVVIGDFDDKEFISDHLRFNVPLRGNSTQALADGYASVNVKK